jgi:hypothetical protein
VRDQVRDKLDYAFEDLGELQVKNIARPVRAYRVRDPTVLAEQLLPVSPQRFASTRQTVNRGAALR